MRKKLMHFRTQSSYMAMVLPGLAWLALFNIVPMFGIVMAFENYNPSLGLWHSPKVGFSNFSYLFSMSDARRVILNTLIIAFSKIALNVVIPLAFALLLNEVTNLRYKKFVQTAVYLPHFISWVILASIVLNIFSLDGIVNQVVGLLGMKPVVWFGMSSCFRQLVVGTDVWKEFGFNAVIYLAALAGINPTLYEAATIDGCNKWKSTLHITIPGIMGTVVLMGVLGLGNVLNAGFDQIYNIYNPLVYSTGDILDTWVYRIGLVNLQFSLATTAGLFKSLISFVMIVVSYLAAYKFADYKIF